MTDVQLLKMIKTDITSSEESVTVLYGRNDGGVAAWCKEQSWPYIGDSKFTGCEDSCVVVLGTYGYILEAFSRGKHRLIIVTVDNR